MFCKKCGKEIKADVSFCPFCGAPLPKDSRQMRPEPQPAGPKAAPKKKNNIWLLPVILLSVVLLGTGIYLLFFRGGRTDPEPTRVPVESGSISGSEQAAAATDGKETAVPPAAETTPVQTPAETTASPAAETTPVQTPAETDAPPETQSPVTEPAATTVMPTEPEEKIRPLTSLNYQDIYRGQVVSFGRYEQDNDLKNGAEPIEWIVYYKGETNVYMISRYILDAVRFSGSEGTFENSDLDRWLEGGANSFMEQAFSLMEQNMLPWMELDPPKNDLYPNTRQAGQIYRHVGVSSINELFGYLPPEYLQAAGTPYALAQGLQTEDGYSPWWTRTMGRSEKYAGTVDQTGDFDYDGMLISRNDVGVRPVICISNELLGKEGTAPTTSGSGTFVPPLNVGDIVQFGRYEIYGNPGSGGGFEYRDPLEWIVISYDEQQVRLLSRYILDVEQFHPTLADMNYASSDIRAWLNNFFLQTAFTAEEQNKLLIFRADASKNPAYTKTGQGTEVYDKVTLLSVQEIEECLPEEYSRMCYGTPFAINYEDLYVVPENNHSAWWTRTMGVSSHEVAIVESDGDIHYSGWNVTEDWIGIRPGICLSWDTVTETMESPAESVEIGDQITLGSYDGQTVDWTVLEIQGDDALLISTQAIEGKPYHDTAESVTWETCSLRRWLNGDFYQSCFTEREKQAIEVSRILNEDNPQYGTAGGNETDDRVFLLSIQEALSYFGGNGSRICSAAQPAKGRIDTAGGCWWRLRSPGVTQEKNAGVYYDGSIDAEGSGVSHHDGGIRPVIRVSLSRLP